MTNVQLDRNRKYQRFRIPFLVFSFSAFGFVMSVVNVTLLSFLTVREILTGMISHTASGVSANLATKQTGKKVRF